MKLLNTLLLTALLLILNSGVVLAQSSVGKADTYSLDRNVVTVHCEKGDIIVAQCAKHAWKVSCLPVGKSLSDERKTITLTHENDNVAAVTAIEQEGKIIVTNGFSKVSVDKATGLLSFADGNTVRLAEKNGIDNTKQTKIITFAPQGDNAFYGGGYNGVNNNMNGKTLLMNNTQNYNWSQLIGEGKANNICVPFVVSDLGYGILFEDHYIDAVIKPSGSEGTTFTSDSPTPISYVYIGSEQGSMAGVMETYADVTGRHELPPYWALGYISSRYGYHSQAETENVIAQLQAKKMPVSGVVLDLFWEGEKQNGMGNLDWYRPNWPNAETMMSDFRKKGVHTIIITEPYFAEETANYAPLLEKGLFVDAACPNMTWVSNNKVGLLDFMNPASIDWMWDFYKAHTDEGVDGWWLDLGEPEMVHDDVIHADKSTVKQAHNEFGQHWIEGVWTKWKEVYPDQRPLFLPRSGTSGMQRYATYPWTGDIARSWDGLKAQVPALVNGGMSGLGYLSSDIGGFVTDENNTTQTGVPLVDVELYLRWFQLGVFSPVLRTHSQYKPEPYNDEYASIEGEIRDLMNLRFQMLPYNYSSAWRNTTFGSPITMPIDFYGAEPQSATRMNDEYLFGPNILVAPIMDANTSVRDVYLPNGEWIDPITFERQKGGKAITFTSSDKRLPHYYRCGTFTPFFTQQTYTNTESIKNDEFNIFYPISNEGEETQPFTLYDDDKTSVAVGNRYETITFSAQDDSEGHMITIQGDCPEAYEGRPAKRVFHFIIPMGNRPVSSCSVSGEIEKSWIDEANNTFYVDAVLDANTSLTKCQFTINYSPAGIVSLGKSDDNASELYSLNGIRIDSPSSSGVYIKNKRKFILNNYCK